MINVYNSFSQDVIYSLITINRIIQSAHGTFLSKTYIIIIPLIPR